MGKGKIPYISLVFPCVINCIKTSAKIRLELEVSSVFSTVVLLLQNVYLEKAPVKIGDLACVNVCETERNSEQTTETNEAGNEQPAKE